MTFTKRLVALLIAVLACSDLAAEDFSVRVRVVSVAGMKPAARAGFTIGVLNTPPTAFTGAAWSPWVDGRADIGAVVISPWRIAPEPAIDPFPRLTLQVETRIAGGETSTSEADLFGPLIAIELWKDAEGAARIDTRAGHIRRTYGPLFEAAKIAESDRPKRFAFGDRFLTKVWEDNDVNTWKEGPCGLAKLGFNCHQAEGPAIVTDLQKAAGMPRIWGAIYNPPGYAFNFDPKRKEIFKTFVDEQLAPVFAAGWKKDDVAFWFTSDEPGWYYPAIYEQFNADPNAMAAFHAYLKGRGMTPALLGQPSWKTVRLIGRREYTDLPSRRLFYWSNRFVPWASSRFFAEVTRAFEDATRADVQVMVNFNNFMGVAYQPGPINHNDRKTDPNAAMGTHDWLEFGRERGATAMATEDWFGDSIAALWSFYAARMRSASDLSGTGFGALIIPRCSGDVRNGMAQKLLALVGNGAKTVKFFTFGPDFMFPGCGYSENTRVLAELSSGLALVGRAERLLFPGKPRPPQVAILTPQSSQFWDLEEQDIAQGLIDTTNYNTQGGHMRYLSEMYAHYVIMMRAAVPVRFVDEQSLAEGDLAGIRVLHITAPDLPKESLDGVLAWVRTGGTLVTVPGAIRFDRYHQPLTGYYDAAGLKPGEALREIAAYDAGKPNGWVEQGGEPLVVWTSREDVVLTGATATAAYDDGKPAVIERALGAGRIVHFTTYPGYSYIRSAYAEGFDRHIDNAWADLVLAPLRATKPTLPVTVDQPSIEAPALYSAEGVAVTLLNWSGRHQPVTVTVAVDKPVKRIESSAGAELTFSTADGAVVIELSLAEVDVLSVYY